MADDVGKTYSEIRKRAEKRGAEASVHSGGVSVHYRGKTKTIRTHDELDVFLGARADSRWDDVHWAADCLRERVDSVRRADAVRADADDIKVSFDKQYRGALISATRTVGGEKVFGFDDAFAAYRNENGTYDVKRGQNGQLIKAGLSEADAKAEMKRLLMNAPVAPRAPVMRAGYSELQGLFGVPKRRR